VMVLELNIARIREQLAGETSGERFRSFCERLRDPEVRFSMAQDYPVLFRSLYVRAMNWVDYTIELLSRFGADWERIRTGLFPESDPGRLTAIAAGAGDTHRQGRTVAILQFSSGLKLVYKPRSMSLDVHFAEFLEWVNQSGFEPRFRALKVIDCRGYGWSEFVDHKPCSSRQEVARFYERLGGYLAIFHALRGNDMHFENLIAAGEFPVPVDIETLFHPVVNQGDDPAFNAWQSSVLSVLMLPTRILGSDKHDGVDISGLGGKDGQYYPPGTVETWEGAGTDEMRLVRDKRVLMTPSRNRPKLDTEDVSLDDFVESFVDGFTRVYRLIQSRCGELESILGRFAADDVRFIARPTASYQMVLAKAAHPDLSRNALTRDRLFDYLWAGTTGQPHLPRLIPAEIQDLHSGDVPVFTTRPDSRDLWTSSGERIEGFFEQTAMEAVRHGLRKVGDDDLALQTWYIRAAIASGGSSMNGASVHLPLPETRNYMELARAVGDALLKQALEYESYASWVGLAPVGPSESSWALEPLDLGLHAGISGCSFFLAYLGALTGEGAYSKIARKSMALVRRQLERMKLAGLPVSGLGGFAGVGGIVYTLAHLGFLWQDESLIDDAHLLASTIPPMISSDRMLDVISGSAGCIAALSVLNSVSPKDRLLEFAVECGDHLLRLQKSQDVGAAWETDCPSVRPLTGFSHGAAGMAWALLKLAAWSRDPRFRAAAESAIAYERSTFVPEQSNWPDFRKWNSAPKGEAAGARFCVAWCHGAPGIALARMDSLPYLDDRATRDEIRVGLEKTAESGFGIDLCLCHGDFGNLDIVTLAEQRMGPEWSQIRQRLVPDLLASLSTKQAPPAPGLMVGLAGIGHTLLRLAYPGRVPSVLVLEPPVRV